MRTKNSYCQILRRLAARLLSLLAILAITFPARGSVNAQENPPNPNIEAFAWFDRYNLANWPEGIPIEVSIENPDYVAAPFTPDSPNSGYNFYPGVDLQPGTVITATNGETTKVLEISSLSATAEGTTGTVTGVATPNRTFHMKTDGDHFQLPVEQDITADPEGNWSVTIEANLPWEWLTEGYMWEGDEDGDVTYAIWHVHQEIMEVWLAQNEIIACDWPLNTELTFTANDVVLGTASTVPLFWYNGTWAVFEAGDFKLEPGMLVTVTDGTTTKSTIIQDLKIAGMDVINDRVYGYAPANAELELASTEDSPIFRFFNNGEDPNWTVDYQIPSLNGLTVDLNPGDYLRLFMRDAEKDSTVWDAYAANPRLTAFPNEEWVEAFEWPMGANLHLLIDDPATGASPDFEQYASLPPEDPNAMAHFDFNGQYDLKPGDEVTVTDGWVSRAYTVQHLSTTAANAQADRVTGTADSGVELTVWPHGHDQEATVTTTAAENGAWQADFSGLFDLVVGTCGRSQITDEFGNATAADWCTPKPWLIAFPENDAVEGWEWPQGDTVSLTINNAPGLQWSGTAEVTSWGDPRTYVRIEFGSEYNLQIGDIVQLTDGTITITHTVQNLGVIDANQNEDFIAGRADPGTEIQVWPHGHDQEATVTTSADGSGAWRADLAGLFDLVVGTCGRSQIRDENGFATAVDWCAPKPWMAVFPAWDVYVQAFDYPLGASVHLAIDDPATGNTPDFEADQLTEVTGWNQNGAWAVFSLPPDYNVKTGDIVNLTSAGITPRVHTVQNLSIDTLNIKTDSITGKADSGALIQVWPWGLENDFTVEKTVAAGNWQVDYGALGLDLVAGMSGRVQIPVDGNYTAMDWDARPTYDIYAYNPLKGTTQRITYLANTDEYNPAWSPNGKLIAHDVVKSDGSQSIYITDVKTGVSKPLAGAEMGGNDAAWSPNGKWIAFDQRWTDTPNVIIVPAGGGSPTWVRTNAFSADWAPNGKRLVFIEKISADPNAPGRIKTAAVDGGKRSETLIVDLGNNPAWSPDGNWIAYDLNGDIWKVRVNDQGKRLGAPILVADINEGAGNPTWSPDSRTIAFHSGLSSDYDIWTVRAAGGIPRRLTGMSGFGDYDPAYAKNSLTISYGGYTAGP